jgi:ankyrin repeat protein
VGLAELLLDKGAKIKAADVNGLTSLHIAGIEGRSSMVELLLKRGAKVDTRPAQDMTTLQGAVSRAILQPDAPFFHARRTCEMSKGHVKTINLLVQAGPMARRRSSVR